MEYTGDQIRRLRELGGFIVSDISDQIAVSETSISAFERGKIKTSKSLGIISETISQSLRERYSLRYGKGSKSRLILDASRALDIDLKSHGLASNTISQWRSRQGAVSRRSEGLAVNALGCVVDFSSDIPTAASFKKLRKASGHSSQSIADVLDVHRSTILKWESDLQDIPHHLWVRAKGVLMSKRWDATSRLYSKSNQLSRNFIYLPDVLGLIDVYTADDRCVFSLDGVRLATIKTRLRVTIRGLKTKGVLARWAVRKQQRDSIDTVSRRALRSWLRRCEKIAVQRSLTIPHSWRIGIDDVFIDLTDTTADAVSWATLNALQWGKLPGRQYIDSINNDRWKTLAIKWGIS
jgi:transcriptional regulator with XRE-family HTH domain